MYRIEDLLGIGAPNTGGHEKYFLMLWKAFLHDSSHSNGAPFFMSWLKW